MIAPPSATSAQLEQLHQTYCRLTGQNLSLRFDRERLWFEFLRAGFTLADLGQVVRYLQRKSATPAATSAPSNYPTSSNWTASRRTSTSAGFGSAQNLPRLPPHSRQLALRRNKNAVGNAPCFSFKNSRNNSTKHKSDGTLGFRLLSAQLAPTLSR